MDLWSQNEEIITPSEADRPELNPLEIHWCNLNNNNKKRLHFFYMRNLLRGMFFFILLCVVCKDGPPIFFFYVVAVAFSARIQPLTSHYVSLHVGVVL